MNEITLSISQLNNYIKNIFDAEEMLIGINVFGEITNFKLSSKATFFDLKDEDASLPCVAFDSSLLDNYKNGDKVVIKGHLNYSVKFGKLSFVVSKIESLGQGELYKRYLELKSKLEKEGVFDERYKKPIKEVAKRIGVVTSETGAVIHDIIKVTRSKNDAVDIVLYPVKVQGVNAESEIIRGIKFFDQYDVDTIIVARGGGSFEDYAPFNSEEVVRCVFECKKPVISAIGHENDWSLIDFVADARASTPSVAAEIAVFDLKSYRERYFYNLNRITNLITKFELDKKKRIKDILDLSISKTTKIIDDSKFKLNDVISNIKKDIDISLIREQSKLDMLTINIEKSNPMHILKKGFSRVKRIIHILNPFKI